MSAATIQEMVAEKIKTLYRVSHELEELFPGRHYTPDGHMIGSIGEALAACCYGLTLFEASKETHDAKAPDGRMVQIKATQIDRVALSSEPDWLLVLQIHPDGNFSEVYNGPGELAWEPLLGKTEERPAAHLFGKAAKPAGRGPGRGPAETDHVRCLYAYLSFDLWQQCRGLVY